MESYDALLASITPATGETRTILDPATGTAVGEAPVHTVEDLQARHRRRPGSPAGMGCGRATTPGPPRS